VSLTGGVIVAEGSEPIGELDALGKLPGCVSALDPHAASVRTTTLAANRGPRKWTDRCERLVMVVGRSPTARGSRLCRISDLAWCG